MIIRYKIKLNGVEVLDLGDNEAFRLDRSSFPNNWLSLGGALPTGYTAESYDATPAPPAPPPPAPPPTRWQVGYVNMLDRMTDANANSVAAYVEGLNAKQRERIRREGVWSDNQTIRDRLTQAGEDPDVILGQP